MNQYKSSFQDAMEQWWAIFVTSFNKKGWATKLFALGASISAFPVVFVLAVVCTVMEDMTCPR